MKRVLIIVLLAFLSSVLAGCGGSGALSPEELKAYQSKISFSSFRMSAAENMAGTAVYDVTATVTNGTDRAIKRLQVMATFRNAYGLVCLKGPATVVDERRGALAPHQSRDFRMGFEGLPESWNRSAPELEVTKLELAQ